MAKRAGAYLTGREMLHRAYPFRVFSRMLKTPGALSSGRNLKQAGGIVSFVKDDFITEIIGKHNETHANTRIAGR